MSDEAIHQFLLSTDGVNQLERSLASLDPATVRLDPRSPRDMLRFLYALAEQIRFYDLDDRPHGDWRALLDMLTAGGEVLPEPQLDVLLASRQDWPPHLALLMAFLRAFSFAQADLNRLPARRLDFYYQDVLGIRRRPAVADQVHLLFELAKNAPATRLAKGTVVKAGTTTAGEPLVYALDGEIVVGHARVERVMTSYADSGGAGARALFRSLDAAKPPEPATGWRPFGSPQLRRSESLSSMEPAPVGCAVASPALFLAEGERTVTVTMRLRSRLDLPPGGIHLPKQLDVRMTTESGWISPDAILQAHLDPTPGGEAPGEHGARLVVTARFGEDAPAITAYDDAVHQAALQTQWPVWSMTPRPGALLVDFLSQFTVTEVEIEVGAKGLRDLVLQNDQAVQPADAPVLPFGTLPRVGGSFYIGSREAFSKSLTSLAVHLDWEDPPASLASHYAGYGNPNVHNGSFLSELYLLAGKRWNKLTSTQQTLFNSDARTHKTIVVPPATMAQQLAYTRYARQPELPPSASFGHQTRQGFVRLELAGPSRSDVGDQPPEAPFEAFGHKSFAAVYARRALQAAQGEAVVLPRPPYTPALAAVAIDYAARETFRPAQPNRVDQFFLLDVFGAADASELASVPLVPAHPHQAALYLGLDAATAPQVVSLLFIFDEGSAPGAEPLRPDEIAWHYLAGSGWKPIERTDLLEDRTDGFQVAGLVRLVLGADATHHHSLMPAGLHWLRASVASKADGAANVTNIHTQAARAALQIPTDREAALAEHLATPLPPERVTGLLRKLAPVKRVHQPYPSFGGRPPESDADYYRRVHERLRHRGRAVAGGDYERLVLEAFPEIYKVKCLPHTDAENALAPGQVKLVIVPDWRKRATGSPLRPKANRAFLRSIEAFVRSSHTSPFADAHVANPVYEALLVSAKVRFKSGYDPGYHAAKLEDEITRFLSPWAFEEGEDIVFGGKIHASEILAFIEGHEAVEHVTDFELYHQYKGDPGGGIGEMRIGADFVVALSPPASIGGPGVGRRIGEDFVVGQPLDTAAATRPDAILVSSDHHRIGILPADSQACQGIQSIGIGQMVVGLDFVVVT
jgi:hypothetical protein